MENVKCVPNSFYAKLACISVGVRRCAGADGEVGYFGSA